MDPKRKFFLLKQSNNFCAAPWTNLYLEANGDVYTCCVGKVPLGNIRKQKLDEILLGDVAINIKTKLLQDLQHENCNNCYQLTTNSDSWLRTNHNNLNKSTNIDFDQIDSFKLTTVDMRWSNACNLKCVYCTPECSSSIEKEFNIQFSNGNLGNNLILEFILANQSSVTEIYLAGGEPLLMRENRQFLEAWTNFDTTLRINTNLTNIHEKNSILSLIKRFKNVLWTISVDNTNERYEYTRYGSNWQQFLINVETIKDLGHDIKFNIVYFVGNAMTFEHDIKFLHQLVPTGYFSVVPVIEKDELSVSNLPINLKEEAVESLRNVQKSLAKDQGLCNNILNCINELNKNPNGLSYQEYFNKLDSKRGTNWQQIFPELA